MTSLEHVSVEHGLNRSSSWTGNSEGEVVEVWAEEGVEVVEVGVGVALTTSDDEDEYAGEGGEPEPEEPERENEDEDEQDEEVGIVVVGDETWSEDGKDERHVSGGASGSASSVGADVDVDVDADVDGGSESVASRGRSSGASPRGSAFRVRSRSNSGSHSQSQSRSSIKEALEMGKSSAATSWTQAERPSGDSERRPSADQAKVRLTPTEEVVDVPGTVEEVRALREGTEVGTLSHLRTNASVDGGRNVSRKEEVLVVQEEDIGEGWHPLQYNGKARSQEDQDGEGEKGEGEREEDVGSVHALESMHGGDPSSVEMSEKERWRTFGSSGRNARHLRLEFKPPSPQPWDEIDRATDNNETYMSDYYSTLNSKKFGTLQKSRRRPLIPHSTYYFGPPPPDSAYGTPPVGQIGVHHPREIVRIERDYGGGELVQFSPVFPLELEGRITPTQFLQTINDINEMLISAHSVQRAFIDNCLAVITLQLSTLVLASHYTKEMERLKQKIDELNTQLYNPVGLHILWPQKVAFLFLEIEYY